MFFLDKYRSYRWTLFSFIFAFLVVIFNTIKLVRVFSLKLLRGIPKEWTFELNLLLSISFFFHLMGFVYANGLPNTGIEISRELKISFVTAIFILLALIFHIVSTVLLINYSPPSYLLI